LQSQNTLSMHI